MFSRIGKAAFKKDLFNTILLCNYLGNPEKQFKSIHVGGTNGKGSVSHMLASVFQTASYKTGLYTSPHLYDFKERIKINGRLVEEDFVIDFTQRIQPLIEEIQPSFFEITVAMAFKYFAENNVDVAVIEVGLGGRLDSTNIIIPELSIVTNISLDHTDMLGETLEKIAFEKAGIIKENVPVVIGQKNSKTDGVFIEVATEKHSPITFAEDNFKLQKWKWDNGKLIVDIIDNDSKAINIDTDLPGIYQTKNIITVLQALEELNKKVFNIDKEIIKKGLKQTRKLTGLYGRWEVIHQNPKIILDVAHNPDGLTQIISQLQSVEFNNLHIIFGMVKDKDTEQILQLLPPTAKYYFTEANIPRALNSKELMEKGALHELNGNIFSDVNAALQAAILEASVNDLIIVTGSIFLVAEVDKNKLASYQ